MTLMINRYYEIIKDYLHPNVHTFVDHYRNGDLIDLPFYHGCDRVNRNGTRKLIEYRNGMQCICPTNKPYWKITKDKYKRGAANAKRRYFTRYMNWTRQRFLFKNKGNFIYNYKLKKFEHISQTPLKFEYDYLQRIKENSFTNVLK